MGKTSENFEKCEAFGIPGCWNTPSNMSLIPPWMVFRTHNFTWWKKIGNNFVKSHLIIWTDTFINLSFALYPFKVEQSIQMYYCTWIVNEQCHVYAFLLNEIIKKIGLKKGKYVVPSSLLHIAYKTFSLELPKTFFSKSNLKM